MQFSQCMNNDDVKAFQKKINMTEINTKWEVCYIIN